MMTSGELSLPTLYLGAFLAGAAGSVHCLSMCGPIAALLGAQARPAARFVWQPLVYQIGRLAGYVLLAVSGASLLNLLSAASGVQLAALLVRLVLAASLLLIGGYLLFAWRALDFVTRIGQGPWRYLRRWISHFLPPRHLGHIFLLGLLWGWLPCGMVYAMLGVAWSTAAPVPAALTMLAFGLGTTPMMLGAASSSAWLRQRLGQQKLRRLAGGLLILAGIFCLVQLWPGVNHGHQHSTHQHTPP